METKRQKQIGELIKRNMSLILQEEGTYFYGTKVLVTVTDVKMTPDLTLAKIYLSIFNTENKQEPILEIRENTARIRHGIGNRMKSQMRRIPELAFYLDDTIDEMYRVDELFQRLHADNQMGTPEDKTEE